MNVTRWLGLLLLLPLLLAAQELPQARSAQVYWEPLPAGWKAWYIAGQDSQPIVGEAAELRAGRHIVLNSGGPDIGRIVIEIRLSDRDIRTLDQFAGEFAGHGLASVYRYEETRLAGVDAFHASPDTALKRYQDWLLLLDLPGGRPWIAMQATCARSPGKPGYETCEQRAAEQAQILASLSFDRPPATHWSVRIEVPSDLKPGDELFPTAVIVDDQGRAPSGEVTLIWRFDGQEAKSQVWDGRPLRIEVDASIDGRGLAATLQLPRWDPAAPPPPRTPPAPPPPSTPPGLQGPGALPGPRNATEGLTGTLGPAALGLLGALLSGLLNAPKGPQAPPRDPKPGKTPPPRRATTEPKPATPGDEPRKPAHPERAARARRAAEAAERAQREADEANRPGRLFTDTLGRSGKEIVDTAKTIGEAAKSARRTIGHTLTGLREVVSDRKALAQAARAGVRGLTDGMRLAGRVAEGVAGAAADGLIAAQDAAGRVYQNPGLLKSAAGAAAKALWKQLSDPKVLWGALKEFSGLQNFENALDPKRSLLQRIGEVGAGTFKLYGAAQMAASAASAARDAAGRALGGGKAAAGALGERGAASAAARAGARAPHTVAPGTVVRPSAPPRPIPRPNAPYRPAVRPPDLRGMPRANVKHAQVVADKYGVQIHVRPTNPEARRLLEAGAHPKPEYLKMKTINSDDILLGAPRDGAGKVGYFKPEMPPRGNLSDDAWQRLEARAAQRAKEFDDQAPKVAELLEKGKIRVRPDGTVVHGTTGRPFTGDHDLFDIRGVKGETLPAAVRERIQRELSNGPFRAQHPEHVAWDYSNLRRTLAPGETSSPYDIARGVDEKILNSHARGGEPLIRFRSDRPITSSWYTGGSRA